MTRSAEGAETAGMSLDASGSERQITPLDDDRTIAWVQTGAGRDLLAIHGRPGDARRHVARPRPCPIKAFSRDGHRPAGSRAQRAAADRRCLAVAPGDDHPRVRAATWPGASDRARTFVRRRSRARLCRPLSGRDGRRRRPGAHLAFPSCAQKRCSLVHAACLTSARSWHARWAPPATKLCCPCFGAPCICRKRCQATSPRRFPSRWREAPVS